MDGTPVDLKDLCGFPLNPNDLLDMLMSNLQMIVIVYGVVLSVYSS